MAGTCWMANILEEPEGPDSELVTKENQQGYQ